ncbi:helix-turn-helix domain-containing protein [Phormidesmis sp. 146-33]
MTITISGEDFFDLLNAEKPKFVDPSDPRDQTQQYSNQFGQGCVRSIELREGLAIEIGKIRWLDQIAIHDCEEPAYLTHHFHLFGQHQDQQTTVGDREYALYGRGLYPKQTILAPAQSALEVQVYIEPTMLRSLVGDQDGELPIAIQNWIRPEDQVHYARSGVLSPVMQTVLWQIVRCPYQGTTKRLFIEGKTLELMSLVIEQEQAIYLDRVGTIPVQKLSPGTIERVHYARNLLLQNLHEPPSIATLAKQVKLNECTLKRGFRACFGTTPFDYLREYRLEQARQLLEYGEMKVEEIAARVGFASRSHFAIAFKKKFGQNPKDYQQRKFF